MGATIISIEPIICRAIRTGRRLEFEYSGQRRVVEPYCHGTGSKGQELLRAVQVIGPGGNGFGKLWTVAKIVDLRLGEEYRERDPHYNPDDSAMATIHCRVGPGDRAPA